MIAFAAMSMVSSAVYIFNDLLDIERDRLHPRKRLRPLASGAVSKRTAVVLGILMLFGGLALGAWVAKGVLILLLVYLAMQVLYNWRLKHTPVADVYTIALGFVLRAVLGASAVGVAISGWLLFCTGALALMLGFAKRRNEFVLQGDSRGGSRESLVHYNRLALDALVVMFAAGAAMCYGIYTLESETARRFPGIVLTSIFVFYGITRYVLLIFTLDEGGEPADVLFKVTAVLAMSGMRLPMLEG